MPSDEIPPKVGYRQPPKHTQFRKGMSGNPKGRPKGSRSLASIFKKISEEKIPVLGPKGPRFMTKLEAGITQLVNRAAKGDLKAIREMMRCRQAFGDQAGLIERPIFHVHFVDPKDGKPSESEENSTDEQ